MKKAALTKKRKQQPAKSATLPSEGGNDGAESATDLDQYRWDCLKRARVQTLWAGRNRAMRRSARKAA
jgi:hypothetical protein